MKKSFLILSGVLFLFAACRSGAGKSGSATDSSGTSKSDTVPLVFPCTPITLPASLHTLSENYKNWIRGVSGDPSQPPHPADAITTISLDCNILRPVITGQATLRLIPIANPSGGSGNVELIGEVYKNTGVIYFYVTRIPGGIPGACFPNAYVPFMPSPTDKLDSSLLTCPPPASMNASDLQDAVTRFNNLIHSNPENVMLQITLDCAVLSQDINVASNFKLIPTADLAGNVVLLCEVFVAGPAGQPGRYGYFDIKSCFPLVDSRGNQVFCPPPVGCSVN